MWISCRFTFRASVPGPLLLISTADVLNGIWPHPGQGRHLLLEPPAAVRDENELPGRQVRFGSQRFSYFLWLPVVQQQSEPASALIQAGLSTMPVPSPLAAGGLGTVLAKLLVKKSNAVLIAGSFKGSRKTSSFVSLKPWKHTFQSYCFPWPSSRCYRFALTIVSWTWWSLWVIQVGIFDDSLIKVIFSLQ